MGGDAVEAEFSVLPDEAFKGLESSDFTLEIKKRESALTVLVKNGAEAVPRIVELVNAKGGKIHSITLRGRLRLLSGLYSDYVWNSDLGIQAGALKRLLRDGSN